MIVAEVTRASGSILFLALKKRRRGARAWTGGDGIL
jgi:hypothetical protein